ncbi:MAG: hypothetical protein O7C59_02220 [Rickettsia endosymbiont of Ixodes persulcatus]|nr:hypothetical protein [Rickettsia endosymbiont of Ixodes persulcatus]
MFDEFCNFFGGGDVGRDADDVVVDFGGGFVDVFFLVWLFIMIWVLLFVRVVVIVSLMFCVELVMSVVLFFRLMFIG